MPDRHDLETRLAATWPPESWQDVTVLLAVSGGADSVALLRAVVATRRRGEGQVWVAHFNHQLRGEESAADESFVVALCGQLEVPCRVGRAKPGQLASDSKEGLENAARSARYDFLLATAGQLGARYVVTAHTADDQAETILHRIVRGTGIGGLAGIARARPLSPVTTLLRPLLGIRRAELLAYLAELGQPYRLDASNQDPRFTRNRIRHHLLPELARQVNPAVVDALLRLGTLAGEVLVEQVVAQWEERAVVYEPCGAVAVAADLLAGQPRYALRELLMAIWRRQHWPLQAMGFEQWELLAQMLLDASAQPAGAGQKRMFPGGVVALARHGQLRLEREDRDHRSR